MERLREEIEKGKSEYEALVKEEEVLLDVAKWWYLIRLGELGTAGWFRDRKKSIHLCFSELALKIPELRKRPVSYYQGLRAGARCSSTMFFNMTRGCLEF